MSAEGAGRGERSEPGERSGGPIDADSPKAALVALLAPAAPAPAPAPALAVPLQPGCVLLEM